MNDEDRHFMERAVEIAREAERAGNPPVGAVVVLDGKIVAEGRNAVRIPEYHPGRHAETEALDDVPTHLWFRADEMTCFSTLEPCPMCAGSLLLHGVEAVVFGARDPRGGAGGMLEALPPYFDDLEHVEWRGPVMPETCRPLFERAKELFDELPVGRRGDAAEEGASGESDLEVDSEVDSEPTDLEEWLDDPGAARLPDVRDRLRERAREIEGDEHEALLPYAVAAFRRGGYLKDYRALEEYARSAGALELLDSVEETLREELPDVWVRRALEAGDVDEAVERWFEIEEHPRARLAADELVEAAGEGRVQLRISCRLARVSHLVERGGRRRYRRACDILRKLRDELDRAGASAYWRPVVDDLADRYDNRPAWLDEMEEAGFLSEDA